MMSSERDPKKKEKKKNHHLPITTFTLIGSAIPNKPTQSAAGPGDEIQISWILEKKKKSPSSQTT